jgi:hypothetical protein
MSRLRILPDGNGTRARATLAFRIALRFPNHIPTAKQIMAAFPEITRATAYRYARDYHVACRAA